MSRVNKTTNNLKKAWDLLDEAHGNIDNAVHNVSRMTGISDRLYDLLDNVLRDSDTILLLKQEIGKLLEEKHGWDWYEKLNEGE